VSYKTKVLPIFDYGKNKNIKNIEYGANKILLLRLMLEQ